MAIKKQTLADQVYEILKSDIIHEVIPLGSKMTLKLLQERFELSTTPLREAMNRLTQEGLLNHVTNVGATVIHLTPKDVTEIYQLSSILDVSAMTLAYTHDPDRLKVALMDAVKEQERFLDSGDIEHFHNASDAFHNLFFVIADNSRLYDASKRIRQQTSILSNRYDVTKDDLRLGLEGHKAVAKALFNDDLTLAQKLFKAHFSESQKRILAQMEGNG